MDESVRFYEQFGLHRKEDGEINTWWNEFPVGDATLALHWNQDQSLPTTSNPELHFQLETTEFERAYEIATKIDTVVMGTLEGIGRIFTINDPNGVRVQFNEVK